MCIAPTCRCIGSPARWLVVGSGWEIVLAAAPTGARAISGDPCCLLAPVCHTRFAAALGPADDVVDGGDGGNCGAASGELRLFSRVDS
ncbi:uncharacterized protein BJ171DRAFT_497665 [Polychytrium aggregatum]|uniref:uncharacterized protein n=1 Tax=Polychytrium aggregatum TaxID=110093 RepID=UPI0022FE5AD7|nr:uncharacterized protein BJ171DRAFT_497665 [Polychytrium aggregatum]KAI9206407.1 hypothetical protein BJ171DRAFT_497665 [Polychytrium aggregatum]